MNSATVKEKIERKIISPRRLHHGNRHIVMVPVCDNGWFPALRRGEIAVVDTGDCALRDGALVCIRGSQNNFSFVELDQWSEKRGRTVRPQKKSERPYWSMLFGKYKIPESLPEHKVWAPDGYFQMADGPLDSKYMRDKMVGHVIGVLGSSETINWAN